MSREAIKTLQERRRGHEDAIQVIDAALKELGASGVRKSRATRRGSNGAGGDRMKAAHAALAAKRAATAAGKLEQIRKHRTKLAARARPAGASLAEAVSE